MIEIVGRGFPLPAPRSIMITVWGRQSSSNVQAVMWCIGELDLSHQRIDAGFTYGVVDRPNYLAMNPNGTIPTIQDGTHAPLWESGAILRYLASQYADEIFWPLDPSQRAGVDQWAEWAKVNIALKFTSPIFWKVVRTPKQRQDPRSIRKAVLDFESSLRIAEYRLEKYPYLAGRDFTLADIQFAHILYRYYDIDIERCTLPAVAEYYQTISQRSAYATHVAISYDELVASF